MTLTLKCRFRGMCCTLWTLKDRFCGSQTDSQTVRLTAETRGRQAAEGQPAESQQRNMVDFEGVLGTYFEGVWGNLIFKKLQHKSTMLVA